MSLVKYAPGVDPFIKSQFGTTFQSGFFGFTMKNKNRQRHGQSAWQQIMSTYLVAAARQWKNLSAGQQAAWQTWIETYPQGTIRDPWTPLSAYHNFVKRNFYKMVSTGFPFTFMTTPVIVEYSAETLSITATVSISAITLNLSFAIADGNQECIIFVSPVESMGKSWVTDATRLMVVVTNVNQTVDITAMYFSKFATIPWPGQKLFCRYLFCGIDNGQFSFPVKIPLITNQAATQIKYGMLYNWPACTGTGNNSIAATGWRVPSASDISILETYISSQGGKLKETGLVYWISPNTGATNEFGFSGRGAGNRQLWDGAFTNLKSAMGFWSTTMIGYPFIRLALLSYAYNESIYSVSFGNYGWSVRLIMENPNDWYPGMLYQGIDGKFYTTCKIGTQVWLSVNLAETLLRDGTPIPEVTDPIVWVNLITRGRCFYNNDPDNM